MTSDGGGGFGASPSVMEIKGTGAFPSPFDPRTVKFGDFGTTEETPEPLVKGGKPYFPNDLDDQSKVGICTSIHETQQRTKVTGRLYSPDFFYLVQKKYIDGNWDEGSSILSALKVAKNFGFLPRNLWTVTTYADRQVGYAHYIKKLQSVPDTEVLRLLNLCVDKIAGYAMVNVASSQALARAIEASEGGVSFRYSTGASWYTDVNGKRSWLAKDIDPIRYPTPVTSGHAITGSEYDFSKTSMFKHPNTWGRVWDLEGQCHIDYSNYKPTECWIVTKAPPVIKPSIFNKTLKQGMTDPLVKVLQKFLNEHGFSLAVKGVGSVGKETDYFGELTLAAVKKFQVANKIPNTGLVASLTRAELNRQWYL